MIYNTSIEFRKRKANKMKYNEIKLNEIESRQYDRQWSRYCTDWVTEHSYISDKNLNKEEFNKILEEKFGKNVCGEIRFINKGMTFANGIKLYKHVREAIMY